MSNLSAEATLASRSRSPESEAAYPILGSFGSISLEPFARYDRDTQSLKMCQGTLQLGLPESLPTLPTSGLMRNGNCYQRQPLVPRTLDIDSIRWPTPVAQDTNRSVQAYFEMRKKKFPNDPTYIGSLQVMVRALDEGLWPEPGNSSKRSNYQDSRTDAELPLAELSRMWPTPTDETPKRKRAVPTPQARDGQRGIPSEGHAARRAAAGSNRTMALEDWVSLNRRFPTPTAQDAKNNGGPAQALRRTQPLNSVVGGQLNPTWVEWLMGFPLGWTDLERSEMPSSLR